MSSLQLSVRMRLYAPPAQTGSTPPFVEIALTDTQEEQIMSDAPVQQPSSQAQHVTAAVADVMRSPVTTVQRDDHAAAAAYLMKHAGASALVVLDSQTDKPIGIITEADIAHAV